METYTLDKWIWTEVDFDIMGWHDATIYGMKLDKDFHLDIDYIFKWNKPEPEDFYFTFIVAPCTLIFKDIQEFAFELIQPLSDRGIEIDSIELEIINDRYFFTIITQQGHISFTASGYTQIVRMHPSFQLGQAIPFDERGGLSFAITTDNKLSSDIQARVNERKAKKYEHFIWAKERHVLKKENEALQKKRDANEISLKDFLEKKNYLRDKLSYYNILLRGTDYETH